MALVLSLKSEMPHHPVLVIISPVCVSIYRQTLCYVSHRYFSTFMYQIIYQECKFSFSFNINSIKICLDLQSQANYCAFSKYSRTAKGIQICIQMYELAHKNSVEHCLDTLFLKLWIKKIIVYLLDYLSCYDCHNGMRCIWELILDVSGGN